MTDDARNDPRDLAASDALNALSPDDAAQLDDELRRNVALAADVEEYRAAVSTLESGVAREQAAPDLFDGVLARIESERRVGEAAQPESARPQTSGAQRRRLFGGSRRRLLPAFAAGIATAAAVVAIALALSSDNGFGTPDARAAVQGTPEFAEVHGEARLYASNREDGTLKLDLAGVPLPASGEHYEVWVLRSDAGGEMEAVGVFSPTGHDVTLELRLPGPGAYEAVDVSVEPDGGPPEHSGRSLAGGRFEPSTA